MNTNPSRKLSFLWATNHATNASTHAYSLGHSARGGRWGPSSSILRFGSAAPQSSAAGTVGTALPTCCPRSARGRRCGRGGAPWRRAGSAATRTARCAATRTARGVPRAACGASVERRAARARRRRLGRRVSELLLERRTCQSVCGPTPLSSARREDEQRHGIAQCLPGGGEGTHGAD